MSVTTRTQNNKSLIDPKLPDALANLKTDIFRTLNCVKVGQIQVFDPEAKTAQIQLLFKRVIPDNTSPTGQSIKDYPVLVDCPVFTPQGGGGALQFPIAAGDQCVVLFADRNIDAWFQNGTAAAPFDARCHDLSDGIALVGLNALGSDLATYPTDKVRLSYAGALLELSEDAVTLSANGTSLTFASGEWSIDDPDGAVVGVAGPLLVLKNNTTTLKTLINGLIDVLALATAQDPISGPIPLTAATIAALNAYKLQIATLLQ